MSSANVLRVAHAEEADAVLRWIRRYYEHDGLDFDEAKAAPAVHRLLSDPAVGRVWFITKEGRDFGYAVATFGFDVEFGGTLLTLTDLYLVPEARGRGLGSTALAELAEQARGLGARVLAFEVLRKNTQAQRFYQRAGFRALDRLPMFRLLDDGASGG